MCTNRSFYLSLTLLATLAGCADEPSGPPGVPTVIFSATSDTAGEMATSIAADQRHVYWIDEGGDLHRVRHDGSEHRVLTEAGYTYDLAAHDGRAYFSKQEGLFSADSLGKVTQLGDRHVIDIAVGMGRVFWLEVSDDDSVDMRAMPAGGGDVESWFNAPSMFSLVVGDHGVYATAGEALVAIREAGAAAEVVVERANAGDDLRYAGAYIYWPDSDGVMQRVFARGGAVEPVGPALHDAVVDNSALYGFSPSEGYTLTRLGFDGSERTITSDTERTGLELASSDSALFWIDWTSECLAWEHHGKSSECVQYDNELRLQVVAK